MAGIKRDSDKIRYDLMPMYPLEEVAKVFTHGAEKYDDRNWEQGMDWNRPYGALLRHVFAFWSGEDIDPESQLHHLAHAICEAMFLLEYTKTKKELDNRPDEKSKDS